MILELIRTGGVGGMRPTVTVDTDQLAEDESKTIMCLVSKVRPERIKQGVDRFSYSLKVSYKTDEGMRSNTFPFGERSHPELVQILMSKVQARQGA